MEVAVVVVLLDVLAVEVLKVVGFDEVELVTVLVDVGAGVVGDEPTRTVDRALSKGFVPPLQSPRKSSMLMSHTIPPPSPFDIM